MTEITPQTLAVDLDDVLAPTSHSIVDYYSSKIGKVLPYGDITAYDYWQSVGVLSDEDAIDIVHAYELAGYPRLYPFADALPVLHDLKNMYRLAIVTARPEKLRAATEEWLGTYFPNIFSTVFMTGNPYTSENHTTKADACLQLGAFCLVDDQLKHCRNAVEVGLGAILFGEYDWNELETKRLPTGIIRCADWQSVRKQINGKS